MGRGEGCECCVCFDIHDPDIGKKRYKTCKFCILGTMLIGVVFICIGGPLLFYFTADPEVYKMYIGAFFTGIGCFMFIMGIIVLAVLCWVLNHDWGKSKRRVAPGGMAVAATSTGKDKNKGKGKDK